MVLDYNAHADAALETAKLTAALPLINTGEDRIGAMNPEMWAGMAQTLREQGILTNEVAIDQVYTLRFLEALDSK